MIRTAIAALSLTAFLGGGLALAAPPAKAAPAGTQYKSKTVYDFDDDVVEGDLVRPDGEMGDSLLKARHATLIKPRTSFVQEMLKSAEDL